MSNKDVISGFNRNRRVILYRTLETEKDKSSAIDKPINLSWQLEEIHKGFTEADAGDFASEEEVQGVFARLTDTNKMLKKV